MRRTNYYRTQARTAHIQFWLGIFPLMVFAVAMCVGGVLVAVFS